MISYKTLLPGALFLILLAGSSCVRNPIAVHDESASSPEISVKKTRQLTRKNQDVQLIDTRSTAEYVRGHLPGALSLPGCGEVSDTSRLPEEKDTMLILYCGWPGCSTNTSAAERLTGFGYDNIRFMTDGVEGWAKADYPLVADDGFVRSGKSLLIDLRPLTQKGVERIPGSTAVALSELKDGLAEVSKKTPIVLCGDGYKESVEALSLLMREGFSNVALVEGGIKGWINRGNPVSRKPPATAIQPPSPPESGKGVSLREFTRAVKGKSGVILLDVRTDKEITAGMFFRAVHIPLDQLTRRAGELPKNRTIYVYSSAGARAKLAGELLQARGFHAKPLIAEVQCTEAGCEARP